MTRDLSNVVVTGASSGFGDRTVRTLARAGYRVFAAMRGVDARNAPAADALHAWAAQEGVAVEIVDMDVTDDASVDAAIDGILAAAGRIDAVVSNAGRGAIGPLEAFTLPQVEALFSVNVYGPLRVARAVLPAMRRQGRGVIVHVSSTIGRVLPGVGGLYPATKWALEGLAESLSYEVKPFGIDAVIVEPGAFPSPALSKAMRPDDTARVAAYAALEPAEVPLGQAPPPDYRAPDLQEVADAIHRLIELPDGQRPLRTVVGPIFTEGVEAFNAEYARASQRLADALRRPDQTITWGPGSTEAQVRPT